ncbi:hypothetical protein CHCC20335_3022 [Bacillus paralicheniformis]|nr:hypothetical protein CHCC20335_3022 [Bacillus paralicheniformis]
MTTDHPAGKSKPDSHKTGIWFFDLFGFDQDLDLVSFF